MKLIPGSRVLVVDDDAIVRHILQAMLEAEGCSVVLAENGVTGLSILREESLKNNDQLPFTLMVLDVMMPQMNGLETLQTLRNDPHLKGLPVLMLTAESKPDDVARGYAAGANFYMTKPFDRAQLLEGISAALAIEPFSMSSSSSSSD